MMRKTWQTRRLRHTPKYTPVRATVTLRARALKSKRARQKHPRTRGSRSLLVPAALVLAVPLLAFGAYTLIRWLHRSPAYIVNEIHVEGAALFTPQQIADKAELKPGRPILDYPIARARRALVADPIIRSATIVRRLPNTIVIRVVERTPIARLRSGDNDFLVDDDGYLLPPTETDSLGTLPYIKGLSLKNPKPGNRLKDTKLNAALLILRLYLASSMPPLMQIESVDVRNLSNVKLYPVPGPKVRAGAVVMLGNGEFEQRLARLDTILHATPKPFKKLDLRLLSRVPAVTN